jgi:hypothetical protein
MVTAFCSALALALIVLAITGEEEGGIHAALRLTARLSYAFFWPAYTASAMTVLFGPAFKPLAQRGRDFGLAFASAHLVHIGLVVWLYRVSARPPISEEGFLFFGIAILWTYVLALFSVERLSRVLGRTGWRALRNIGLEYIAFAFAVDFILPFRGGIKHVIAYLPFAILAVAGWLMRISALTLSRRQARSAVS